MSSQPIRHFSEEAPSPATAEMPALVETPTPERIGPFRITKKLGGGVFGIVYSAEGEVRSVVRQVALRVIPARLLEKVGLQAFIDHQKLLTYIDHPNLARVLDAGLTERGDVYVASEFIQGQRIDSYCLEKALPLASRIRLTVTLCKGIETVHRALFVCGQIKTSNVLVTTEGTPKLIDLIAVPRTAPSPLPLDFNYASPEQVRGDPPTTATDVYLLAILLHELSTGRTPFELRGQTPVEVLRILQEFPLAKTLLPKDVETVLRKAMAADLDHRYRSPADLSHDLEKFLHDRPVDAKPIAAKQHFVAISTRSNSGILVAAAAGVVLVAAFALWIGYRAARDRDIAQRQYTSLRAFAESTIAEMPDALASLPGATKLRATLVSRAVQYLDKLGVDAWRDPSVEVEVARAYQRLARVQDDAGATAPIAPGELLAKAKQHMQAALQSNPGDLELAAELGWIHLHMARSSDLPQKQQDAAATEAEKYWRALRDQRPSEPKVLLGMAGMLSEMASRAGSAANKKMYYTEALSYYESMLENKPDDPEMVRDVASTHRALAAISDPQSRLEHVRTAIQMDERLMKLDPKGGHVDYGLDLTELSRAQQGVGETIEAGKTMDRVIALRRKASESDPGSDHSQARLAGSLTQAAMLAYRQGDADSARALFGEVISRYSKSSSPQRAEVLADAYSGLAEVDEREGHTAVACSSVSIANENFSNAKTMGAEQRKRVKERLDALAARCR